MNTNFRISLPRINVSSKYKLSYNKSAIEECRSQLIDKIYKHSSSNSFEMNLKRKCGIITNELIDYYLNGVTPPNFVNETINLGDDDLMILDDEAASDNASSLNQLASSESTNSVFMQSTQDQIVRSESTSTNVPSQLSHTQSSSSSMQSSTQSSEGLSYNETASNDDITPKTSSKKIITIKRAQEIANEICIMQKELKMLHICKLCPYALQVQETDSGENLKVFYVCDFCNYSSRNQDGIINHLKENSHFSASEYLGESISNQLSTNLLSLSQYDKKLKYLMRRSSIKNFNENKAECNKVFCPQCFFYFDNNISACAIHYKYTHASNHDIYSIGKMLRTFDFEVKKTHSCYTCGFRHKKLTDLTSHLKSASHFPASQKNEINVFFCPIDKCHYHSIEFGSFKMHLMNHPIFNRPATNSQYDELRINVQVQIFQMPQGFLHITPFDEESTKFECVAKRNAIDVLFKMTKGHVYFNEINKRILEDNRALLNKKE